MIDGYINPTYQSPSQNNLESLLDAFRRDVLKNLNCVKIGVVQAFNAALQEVEVQIAYQQVTSIAPDGTKTLAEYPLLLNVPVFFPSGGGFTLTFPIAKGDECIILFNDRQLDNWLTNGAGQPPSIGRAHDLSDGIALVGLRNNLRALAGVSTTTTQLRSDDGATYVEVAGGGIVNIVAPTSINITAPNVNINASSKVLVTTPETDITGIISVENVNSVTNPFTVTGKITATGDIIALSGSSNISLSTHHHTGVTVGGGNTGGPV